jgi:hypothetical protein
MRNSFRAALIASCGKSRLVNGVDGNIKTLISLLDDVQIPSYCYENPHNAKLDSLFLSLYTTKDSLSNYSPYEGLTHQWQCFLESAGISSLRWHC